MWWTKLMVRNIFICDFYIYTFIQVCNLLQVLEELCANANNTSDGNVSKMCNCCFISALSFFTGFKCDIKYYSVRDHAGHQMVEDDLFPWFQTPEERLQEESQFLSLSLQNRKDKKGPWSSSSPDPLLI